MTEAELSDVFISTVERETGLSKDTLRMWERRYGFPLPNRNAHGERVYPAEQVKKLRLISRLLDRGLRPGHLMHLPLQELEARFSADTAHHAGTKDAGALAQDSTFEDILSSLKTDDEGALRSQMARVLVRLGLQRFVVEFAALMNELVGDAWARGEIAIGQEHLYTEQMQALLRHGINTIYPGGQQPTVLLTTLPGEGHQLGLLMAQACLAVEGARCVSLGVQTPAADIARAALAQRADIVGLSFSQAIKTNVAYDMLADLRARLPANMAIWAGGSLWSRARRSIPGVQFISTLTQIPEAIARYRIAAATGPADEGD